MMNIGDKVRILPGGADDMCIDPKYDGQIGTVIEDEHTNAPLIEFLNGWAYYVNEAFLENAHD